MIKVVIRLHVTSWTQHVLFLKERSSITGEKGLKTKHKETSFPRRSKIFISDYNLSSPFILSSYTFNETIFATGQLAYWKTLVFSGFFMRGLSRFMGKSQTHGMKHNTSYDLIMDSVIGLYHQLHNPAGRQCVLIS